MKTQTTTITPELANACVLLFGSDIKRKLNCLADLTPNEVKVAFRKRAFETHPDRAISLGKDATVLNEKFRKITVAYSNLKSYVKKENRATAFPVPLYVPKRKLLLGQFLYYSGLISWDTYIKAIAWQRRQRPRLGGKPGGILQGQIHHLAGGRVPGRRVRHLCRDLGPPHGAPHSR